jgi:hypothetical protein
MKEERKKQIISALNQRVSGFVCPICHQARFTFVDGYTVDPVQEDYRGMQLGGKMIPSVMLVCSNCGHIDRFSLGVLGLMENNDQLVENK